MIPLIIEIDIVSVASRSDNGPLGNVVSSLCNATKFMVDQALIVPNEAVIKLPAKPQGELKYTKLKKKIESHRIALHMSVAKLAL